MKKYLAIFSTIGLLSINGHAGFWNDVNNTLNTTSTALNVLNGKSNTKAVKDTVSSQTIPLAPITEIQSQRIKQLVQANTSDEFLNQAILEAKPNIEGLLSLASCQNDDWRLMVGKYKSPHSTGLLYPVIPKMKYHPLNQCLTVQSVGNWRMPVRDALNFTTVYASDVSPESTKMHIDMKREPNGQWYVTVHMKID